MRRRNVKRARLAKGRPSATAGNIGSALGSTLGGFLPVPGGSAVGGWLGERAGSLLSSLWGSGDYTVKTNSLILDGKPVEGAKSDVIRVRKSEFLGMVRVKSGTEFVPTGYVINPGDSNTFPWLSTLAQCYEEWKPLGILFRFRSTASSLSTSTSLGSIAMATEYDVYDQAPGSKVEMLQMSASTTSSVSHDLAFGIECDPRFNPLGIFFVLPPSGVMQGSNREYNLGTHYVVANGADTEGEVGELWIEYDIEFQKAQKAQGTNQEIDCWHNETAGCYSNTNALLNGGILVHDSALTMPDSNVTANSYYFSAKNANPLEYWCVMVSWQGTVTACTYPTVSYAGCVAAVPPRMAATGYTDRFFTGTAYPYTTALLPHLAGGTTTEGILNLLIFVQITSTSAAAISLSGGTLPASAAKLALTAWRVQ